MQNWWVKKGLLASGLDPAPELSAAAEQFPDEYEPMVFMTGDGHRHPPFEWVNRGVWQGFFDKVVAANKMCCHVECFSDEVTAQAVPKSLEGVFLNNKVFGWEPDFYKIIMRTIKTAMALQLQVMQEEDLPMVNIQSLANDLTQIDAIGYLKSECVMANAFVVKAQRTVKLGVVKPENMLGYEPFLKEYKNTAMALRTGINNVIGANIQRVIKMYPDHMHLITCGDAHIITDPLQQYIQPPIGTFGIADASKA